MITVPLSHGVPNQGGTATRRVTENRGVPLSHRPVPRPKPQVRPHFSKVGTLFCPKSDKTPGQSAVPLSPLTGGTSVGQSAVPPRGTTR